MRFKTREEFDAFIDKYEKPIPHNRGFPIDRKDLSVFKRLHMMVEVWGITL